MASVLPSPIAGLRRKASQKVRDKLRRVLLLPPAPDWTMQRQADAAPSSSPSAASLSSDDSGLEKEKDDKLRHSCRPDHPPPPPPSLVLLHPTNCAHPYYVDCLSNTNRAYCYDGTRPKLCPHCEIAAGASSSSSSSSSGNQEKGATTIAAAHCGHLITVRKSTAAVVRAHPHLFSEPGLPLVGYTTELVERSRKVFATTNGQGGGERGLEKRRVRANLNVGYCVGCLRRRREEVVAPMEKMKRTLEETERDDELLKEVLGELNDTPEWVRCLENTVFRHKSLANMMMVIVSVLEAEEDKAGMEERGEVDVVATEMESWWRNRGKTMNEAGSLLSRSSWRSGASGFACGLMGLTKAVEVEEDENGAQRIVKRVRFDPKFQASVAQRRSSLKYCRKSETYKPGKYAVKNPLDTSGHSLQKPEELRDWYNPKD